MPQSTPKPYYIVYTSKHTSISYFISVGHGGDVRPPDNLSALRHPRQAPPHTPRSPTLPGAFLVKYDLYHFRAENEINSCILLLAHSLSDGKIVPFTELDISCTNSASIH